MLAPPFNGSAANSAPTLGLTQEAKAKAEHTTQKEQAAKHEGPHDYTIHHELRGTATWDRAERVGSGHGLPRRQCH